MKHAPKLAIYGRIFSHDLGPKKGTISSKHHALKPAVKRNFYLCPLLVLIAFFRQHWGRRGPLRTLTCLPSRGPVAALLSARGPRLNDTAHRWLSSGPEPHGPPHGPSQGCQGHTQGQLLGHRKAVCPSGHWSLSPLEEETDGGLRRAHILKVSTERSNGKA